MYFIIFSCFVVVVAATWCEVQFTCCFVVLGRGTSILVICIYAPPATASGGICVYYIYHIYMRPHMMDEQR